LATKGDGDDDDMFGVSLDHSADSAKGGSKKRKWDSGGGDNEQRRSKMPRKKRVSNLTQQPYQNGKKTLPLFQRFIQNNETVFFLVCAQDEKYGHGGKKDKRNTAESTNSNHFDGKKKNATKVQNDLSHNLLCFS
jgi:hypothetical protein